MAKAVQAWLLRVAGASSWRASQDLRAGQMWGVHLARELDSADRAILCMTRDSRNAPWIHFEAGAAFKGLQKNQVVPYLLDFSPGKLSSPLGIFQAVQATREGTLKLLTALDLHVTEENFNTEWPALERELKQIRRRSRLWCYIFWALVLLALVLLVVSAWRLYSTSIFPDIEPTTEVPNTANAAPLQIAYHRCDAQVNECKRGHYHSFDADLSGGYATRIFASWVPISLQGNRIAWRAKFRTGTRTLELGLSDSAGNTAFYDCRSDTENARFNVPLNPKDLLNAKCRINLHSIKTVSIGYASVAGTGRFGFDLYDLSLKTDGSVGEATQCELRRCAD